MQAKIANCTSDGKESDEELKKLVEELNKKCSAYKSRAENAEIQLKHAKLALKKSASISLEKDMMIQELQQKLKKTTKEPVKSIFQGFDSKFTGDELIQIRSVQRGANNDSTFVLKIAKALYKNEFVKLEKKSVTGRSTNSDKAPVTPLKRDIIENMLKERISDEKDGNLNERLKKVNAHIKTAITNIIKAEKRKSITLNNTSASNLQPLTNTCQNTAQTLSMQSQIPGTSNVQTPSANFIAPSPVNEQLTQHIVSPFNVQTPSANFYAYLPPDVAIAKHDFSSNKSFIPFNDYNSITQYASSSCESTASSHDSNKLIDVAKHIRIFQNL